MPKYVHLEFRMFQWLVTSPNTISIILLLILTTLFATSAGAHQSPTARSQQLEESLQSDALWNSNITHDLFDELKELALIADISYCVGIFGISKPFVCATHCKEFLNFELIETFHSTYSPFGNCGFIALDHGSGQNDGRILVVFRGTHSITDAILDLLMMPQKFTPYPSDLQNEYMNSQSNFILQPLHDIIEWPVQRFIRWIFRQSQTTKSQGKHYTPKCKNCTVHLGFWKSYKMIRHLVLPNIQKLRQEFPEYQLNLVGHSLGGAVATLLALELESLGYSPKVTTFGEPRIGNYGLKDYVDTVFNLRSGDSNSQTNFPSSKSRYRRVTHFSDPFPLLPMEKFGYRSHAGEIFISKKKVPPAVENVRLCFGDDDMNCIAGKDTYETWEELLEVIRTNIEKRNSSNVKSINELKKRKENRILPLDLLQLYLGHVDYFSRMDLCLLPGGKNMEFGRDEV
ncbi:putative extracellular lipase [Erysiphe necator]|uniref:Putative extracellular lipase n=1 Tax=Uncinula necator TaxID=52586 RepID=A0A0B1P6X8_UNCNE|nr:putative extracellular lipase [Erysiphe necator]